MQTIPICFFILQHLNLFNSQPFIILVKSNQYLTSTFLIKQFNTNKSISSLLGLKIFTRNVLHVHVEKQLHLNTIWLFN